MNGSEPGVNSEKLVLQLIGAVKAIFMCRFELESTNINFFSTTQAISEFVLRNTLQGLIDSRDLLFASSFGFKRNLLVLKSVHAGQASDTRLIERYCTCGLSGHFFNIQQFYSVA